MCSRLGAECISSATVRVERRGKRKGKGRKGTAMKSKEEKYTEKRWRVAEAGEVEKMEARGERRGRVMQRGKS